MTKMNDSLNTGIPAIIGGKETTLHSIDYEDVALTPGAIKLLCAAAREVLRKLSPVFDNDKMDSTRAVALFMDNVFWDERKGDLVMCAELGGRNVCMPIPAKHWKVRTIARCQ